jgi:acetylornithine/N-succinyldiaminopimelate aminotransferase
MEDNRKNIFLNQLGQTNPFPFLIDVDYAEGIFIYDRSGKQYLDAISGVSVTNIGHRHPKVIAAIQEQLNKHLHVMVYGEFIQTSNVDFAEKLTELLPANLNCVYPVNSGTEAIEASLKLAKRVTGRSQLIAFKGSYHGSTHGSMSVSANEVKKSAFRPLLPDVDFLELNNLEDLERITNRTAGVLIEPIQGDAGVRRASNEFLRALQEKCRSVGALLMFDEIQCGMGRAGKLFAFEKSGIVPDVLILGKALGGGLPIGAFVTDLKYMRELSYNPMLGHITTFGGNPVITAAAKATLDVLTDEVNWNEVEAKGALLESYLKEIDEIFEIRREGLMFACDMASFERVDKVVKKLLDMGVISFWFLSHPYSFRLSPPITITRSEIKLLGEKIQRAVYESANLLYV